MNAPTPLETFASLARAINHDIEIERASLDFAKLAQNVLAHGGKFSEAAIAAQRSSRECGGPRLADIIKGGSIGGIGGIGREYCKAAQSAQSLSGSALQDYSVIVSGFVSYLANAGAFDAMLSSFQPVPLKTGTVGNVSVAAQAFSVGENGVKPVSRLTVVGQQQNPVKAHGIIVGTQELFRMAAPQTPQLIRLALTTAVAITSDAQLVAALTTGLSAATSTGQTAEAVRADIGNLLRAVTTGTTGQPSKLFILTTPLIVKSWSMLTDGHGLSAFPNLTPVGGSIQGMPVIPSDAMTAGNVLLVDASGVAGASGDLVFSEFKDGMVQLDSVPDSPPSASTNYISLWQMNYVALLCERSMAVTRLRADACALCSNSGSYSSGNSPP